MEIANIAYQKIPSLSQTLMDMPIGREQVIPSRIFATDAIRKTCYKLKAKGYEFSVSSKGMVDTCVIRLR